MVKENERKIKIGDTIFVHGQIDEIRNDVIIIKNDGGYFGTAKSEIFYNESQWIPVNDRLPNGQDKVIVSICDEFGDTRYNYTDVGWTTTNGEYWVVDDEINNYVVAWMPMPKPYKEENKNE